LLLYFEFGGKLLMSDLLTSLRGVLREALSLGDRADRLLPDSQLLGKIPEFDSMAVIAIITALEDKYGFAVDDDELSADIFATVGSLMEFVSGKLSA
jgi:acyl carrier protein